MQLFDWRAAARADRAARRGQRAQAAARLRVADLAAPTVVVAQADADAHPLIHRRELPHARVAVARAIHAVETPTLTPRLAVSVGEAVVVVKVFVEAGLEIGRRARHGAIAVRPALARAAAARADAGALAVALARAEEPARREVHVGLTEIREPRVDGAAVVIAAGSEERERRRGEEEREGEATHGLRRVSRRVPRVNVVTKRRGPRAD
jgi:isocitrate lyase